MGLFGEKKPTGHGIRGPAADLIELEGPDGRLHTALLFAETFLEEPAIHDGVAAVRAFLDMPMVPGVVALGDWVEREGLFVYPTGECWSLAEIGVMLKELDRLMPLRAGAELLRASARVLIEAGDAGDAQGVPSHGALSPWRILVDPDGVPMLIGYGVLQPEFSRFHADETYLPTARSLRYAPPERFARRPEDVRSDLFSLGLIGLELLLGEPAYLGSAEDVLDQAQAGATREILDEVGAELPEPLLDALAAMLASKVSDRADPQELLQRLDELLDGELEGDDLPAFMASILEEPRLTDVELPPEDDPEAAPAESADVPAADTAAELDAAARDADEAAAKCEEEVDRVRELIEGLSDALLDTGLAEVVALREEIDALHIEAETAARNAAQAAEITETSEDAQEVFDAADRAVDIWEAVRGVADEVAQKIDRAEELLAEGGEAASSDEGPEPPEQDDEDDPEARSQALSEGESLLSTAREQAGDFADAEPVTAALSALSEAVEAIAGAEDPAEALAAATSEAEALSEAVSQARAAKEAAEAAAAEAAAAEAAAAEARSQALSEGESLLSTAREQAGDFADAEPVTAAL
ncbi:MAG: hypothetical protein EA397_01145, partial [Deltaproteobacteria bacterium]